MAAEDGDDDDDEAAATTRCIPGSGRGGAALPTSLSSLKGTGLARRYLASCSESCAALLRTSTLLPSLLLIILLLLILRAFTYVDTLMWCVARLHLALGFGLVVLEDDGGIRSSARGAKSAPTFEDLERTVEVLRARRALRASL